MMLNSLSGLTLLAFFAVLALDKTVYGQRKR
jgi:hypothetical protein